MAARNTACPRHTQATEMAPEDQTNMIGLFRSFAKMDGRSCGEWTLRFSGQEQVRFLPLLLSLKTSL